jgi:hypothetical protein
MAKKKSPRARFIESVDLKKLAGYAWDAMQLASTHDPDLEWRITVLERQTERLGAPQYRKVK